MKLIIIVARADNGVIGDSGERDDWVLPADVTHWSRLTKGHALIMGRKTLEHFGGAPAGHRSVVITTHQGYEAPGVEVVYSLQEAIDLVRNEEVVYVVGGGAIYAQALPLADELEITEVHTEPAGDIRFDFDPADWQETAREDHPADAENRFSYSFVTYVRRSGKPA